MPDASRAAPTPVSAALAAIRDAYVVLLPITLFGVVATLLGHFPVPAGAVWLESRFPGWTATTEVLVQSTWGAFGLALAVALAARFARQWPAGPAREPLPATWVGASALVNFMVCASAAGPLTPQVFGTGSMLLGIVVGLATPTLLRPLADWPPLRRLAVGYDSDPVLYHATRLTLPMVLLGCAAKFGAEAFARLPWPSPDRLAVLPAAFDDPASAAWLLTPLAVLVNQCLWAFGVHGGKVLDSHFGFLLGVGADGAAPVSRVLIDSFVHLGGSGATLGLLVALTIAARHGEQRRLAQLSWLPAIFNVNELLMFGLPLVLNPRFAVPFVLAPLAVLAPALLALQAGWMTLSAADVPWTTPVLLSGWWLTGSAVGVAVQAVGLLLATLVYLPFVRRAVADGAAERERAFRHASAVIVGDAPRGDALLRRDDRVGVIARGLLHDLRAAIGTPALSLVFQPQHRLDGTAVGVEALLRWQHPAHGAVRADVAVALAEQGGLIGRLGDWVLDAACARQAQWNAQGQAGVAMAVNVSPLQLCDPGLHHRVAAALARHGVRPGDLEIEITESHGIPQVEAVDRNLAALAALGVRLAMDDFGMGHSSLLHLRRFEVAAIKVDGSLSRDVLTNPASADIVEAIARLARARGATVIAEFVETREQRDRLAELGCDVFQGWWHSRALPPDECFAHLARHAAGTAGAAGAAGDAARSARPSLEVGLR